MIKKKVDRFRLDIVARFAKILPFEIISSSFTFIPSDTSFKRFFRNSIYNSNHPDTFEFVKELRKVIDEFDKPPRFLVGEVITDESYVRSYCGGDKVDGFHSVFLFRTLRTKHSAKNFRKLFEIFEENFKKPHIPTFVFLKHNRMRRITRFENDVSKAKLHEAFQIKVRVVPYIYYSEETGMESPRMIVKK